MGINMGINKWRWCLSSWVTAWSWNHFLPRTVKTKENIINNNVYICIFICVYTHTHTCYVSWHEICLSSLSAEVIHDCSVLRSLGRRLATVPMGKEAGVLLVLQTVQLKTRPEPSLSLMWLSDRKNFLVTAFFPVSNNPFVFTHFLPEMNCFLFAW